jgi:hypothetical protein
VTVAEAIAAPVAAIPEIVSGAETGAVCVGAVEATTAGVVGVVALLMELLGSVETNGTVAPPADGADPDVAPVGAEATTISGVPAPPPQAVKRLESATTATDILEADFTTNRFPLFIRFFR